MKFSLLLLPLLLLIIGIGPVHAQDDGYPYTGWAYNDEGQPCENADVQLVVRFVDLIDEEEVYKESFNTTTNERGQFMADISKGTVENGEFMLDYLTKPRYQMVIDFIVDCDGEEVVIVDRNVRRPRVPMADEAATAEEAETAEHWGDNEAPANDTDDKVLMDLLDDQCEWELAIFKVDSLGQRSTHVLDPLQLLTLLDQAAVELYDYELTDPMTPDEIQEAIDDPSGEKEILLDLFGNRYKLGPGGPIPVSDYPNVVPFNAQYSEVQTRGQDYRVASSYLYAGGNTVMNFGPPPSAVESGYIFGVDTLGDLFHALEVRISDPVVPTQNTAAGFFENIPGSAGILTLAGGFGAYNQGVTGEIGISLNDGVNGAGTRGTLAFDPADGTFGYGVLGEIGPAQKNSQAYAGAFFGDIALTGEIETLSDGRLKTEVRSEENALQKVMMLRPTQYEFVDGKGLGLPGGMQHGFIAQEVAEVYPELVSDVLVPKDLSEKDLRDVEVEAYKSVSYQELIPVLTKALQELNNKVDAQQDEIDRLNQVVKELQKD